MNFIAGVLVAYCILGQLYWDRIRWAKWYWITFLALLVYMLATLMQAMVEDSDLLLIGRAIANVSAGVGAVAAILSVQSEYSAFPPDWTEGRKEK